MAGNNHAFAIDDALGTSQNLSAYSQVLEAMDVSLGAALSQYLALLAAGQPVDTAVIWNALDAASAPDPAAPDGSPEGAV